MRSYVITDEKLILGPVATTRMLCEPEIMAREEAFLTALARVTRFQIDRNTARLLDQEGEALMILHADK